MIVRFSVYRYRLPLTEPLMLAHGPLAEREGLLVRLADDEGREGWGEAAPLPGFSRETLGDALAELRVLREAWVQNHLDLEGVPKAPASVRFAVGQALRRLHGWEQPERLRIAVNALLVGDRAAVLEGASAAREAGYRAAKLKMGRQTVEEDAALVREVASALGAGVELRLDANRAWAFEEAVRFAEAVRGVPLAYVEEPLAEPERLPALVDAWGLPIALDETLIGLPAEALAQHAYARAVVLKPMLAGGLGHAEALAHAAYERGMAAVISASFESGVGTQALVALAARLPAPAAHGLDTYRRLAADVFEDRLPLRGPDVDVAAVLESGVMRAQRLEEVLA